MTRSIFLCATQGLTPDMALMYIESNFIHSQGEIKCYKCQKSLSLSGETGIEINPETNPNVRCEIPCLSCKHNDIHFLPFKCALVQDFLDSTSTRIIGNSLTYKTIICIRNGCHKPFDGTFSYIKYAHDSTLSVVFNCISCNHKQFAMSNHSNELIKKFLHGLN